MNALPWTRIKNEDDLLEKRISELSLSLEGSRIEPLVARLYAELRAKGLIFEPRCFLADEWFCPVGIPAIGIPFYLAHPRLRRLEQKIILEVEGGSTSEFMRLIRHETGHAYSYAYHLHKKPQWRRLFGSPSQEYLETYRPRAYSRSFVQHLDHWYAQSHPDEDFAETFAVWLTPNHNWRRRYRGWKAIKKLEYVDRLMNSIAGLPARKNPPFKPKEYNGLTVKLKTYYRAKKKLYEESYPDFYDPDLKMLFTDVDEERCDTKAFQYLKKSKRRVIRSVAFWTKEKKYTIDQLMDNLIDRTRDLNLYLKKDQSDLDIQISAYITSLITSYLFTGKFKRSK